MLKVFCNNTFHQVKKYFGKSLRYKNTNKTFKLFLNFSSVKIYSAFVKVIKAAFQESSLDFYKKKNTVRGYVFITKWYCYQSQFISKITFLIIVQELISCKCFFKDYLEFQRAQHML